MLSIQSARYGVVLNGTGTMVWICCEPFHFRPQTRLNFCLCQVSARRVYLVGAQSAVPTKLTNIGTSGQRQLDFNGLESSGRTAILLVTRRGEANLPNQSSMWLHVGMLYVCGKWATLHSRESDVFGFAVRMLHQSKYTSQARATSVNWLQQMVLQVSSEHWSKAECMPTGTSLRVAMSNWMSVYWIESQSAINQYRPHPTGYALDWGLANNGCSRTR